MKIKNPQKLVKVTIDIKWNQSSSSDTKKNIKADSCDQSSFDDEDRVNVLNSLTGQVDIDSAPYVRESTNQLLHIVDKN